MLPVSFGVSNEDMHSTLGSRNAQGEPLSNPLNLLVSFYSGVVGGMD